MATHVTSMRVEEARRDMAIYAGHIDASDARISRRFCAMGDSVRRPRTF